ncbi:MAG TPA: PAS domain S-box protein [Verrucomicrobiae bacterium]|jgi:PAS domain S-box-containing protein|nr:PAS domain S-box protein [Verrucomicrobiae bacterium]
MALYTSGSKTRPLRVLIVDDHEIVRRGVVSLFINRPDCIVCGEASNGLEAIEKARELKPEIVLMDVSMPAMNGLEATRHIRNILPECEVLILSQHDAPEIASQAFKAGARGYVVKSSIARNLTAALEKISQHESFFDPSISENFKTLDVQEILQRSRALEQALEESEQLYRTTFEGAAIGVAHVHPDGQWLRVNDCVCKITGYTASELLQMRFQDITHPDDLAADLALTQKLRDGALNTFSMEKRYIRKDGSYIWVNLTVSCARTRAELKYFISIIEDITDRRDSERTRARLASIVESSDDAIVSKDLDGTILSWNAGAARIFGYSAEEVIGRSITIIIPPELHDEERMILGRIRRGERIEHYETVRITKSGTRLNVALTISPIRDSKGHVIGASKIARDVTDRHRVETALRESQTQLALALESSRTAIFDWNIIERRGRWNPQLAALYDFHPSSDYVTHEQWKVLFHPEDNPRLDMEYDRIIKDRNREDFEFEFRTARNGKWMLSHGRIVRDAAGNPLRMIGTHTDITDRKQAEEVSRVRELTGKLLHAQDAERRRIARELHDSAGQLVAALQMHLAPLKQEAASSNPQFAASLKQSLDLVQQLSRELRTVSYLLHPPLLDELGLPSALRWYVEGFADRSKIEVHLELPDNLGRLPEEMEMTLFRIVQESLTNIHRHSGSKNADIALTRSDQGIRLEIRDYGKGMAKEQNKSPYAGPGVGIQGMRERVRQLNGEFRIHSRTNGTSVIVRFLLASSAPGTDRDSVPVASAAS